MCGPSKGEKDQAASLNTLSSTMATQAGEVFGADNDVFNSMKTSYDKTVNAGPDQHGFNQAELNARNSSAITNVANQYRHVAGAVKSGQAAYGGGDTVSGAGVTTGQNLQTAQAAAGETASELNQIQSEDFATGRHNYEFAAEHEQQLPSVFNNVPGMEDAALKGREASLQEQQSLDTQAGWWKGPVMGLVNTGLSAATGGLSTLAGGGGFMKGFSKSLGGSNG